ncbi:MAG: hypothetical protein BWZ00_01573 [Bacteroidetes bacterium ADurb.BinA174]|nr:MAG: hypothetical protein BWZ00_01573 [Bacteroidetes bacterium ADurb.BinA174]
MEVKITMSDLKRLIEDSESKTYYYEKLKLIAELFKANKHDLVQAELDKLFLGV